MFSPNRQVSRRQSRSWSTPGSSLELGGETNPDKPRRSTFQLPSAPATPLSTLRAKLTRDTMGRRSQSHQPKSPAEIAESLGFLT